MTAPLIPRASLSLALLAVGLTGCLRQGLYTPAQPLQAGQWAAGLRGNGLAAAAGDGSGILPLPLGAVQLSHGLDGRQDLGLSLGTEGLQAQYKRLLTTGGGPRVALAPELGGIYVPGFALLMAQVPVLIGFPLAGGHEITVGPRVGVFGGRSEGLIGGGRGTFAWIGSVGTSLGACFQLSPRWQLTPELSAHWPGLRFEGDAAAWGADGVMLEAGLALRLLFGGS